MGFTCASFDVNEKFVASCPPTQTPKRKIKKWIFDVQFQGNRFEIHNILNNVPSSTLSAIEIPEIPRSKILKIPEFNLELYSFWSESEINDSELQIDNSQNDSEFNSDDDKSVKYYTV